MEAQPRIGVLEEMGPVEVRQRELVGREMGGHPVQDDADPGAVELIDERHEALRIAVSTGRGEISGRLISPRPVERMLHQRQELHVGETAALHVGDQWLGQLLVAQEVSWLVRRPAPAPQMDFVNGDRPLEPRRLTSRRHPVVVAPFVPEVPHHRTGPWWHLRAEGEWIRLLQDCSSLRGDGELVHVARRGLGDCPLPDARRTTNLERIGAGVPRVEIADHADPCGVRRPDRKRGAPTRAKMGAHLAPEASVAALVEEMQVYLAEQA